MVNEEELARALRENELLAAENERLLRELREASAKYSEIRNSLSWRLTAPLRRMLDWATVARGKTQVSGPILLNDANYRVWVERFDSLTEADRMAIRAAIASMRKQPLFSLLMVVEDAAGEAIQQTVQSIRRQIYREWEICIVDDASTAPHVARALSSCGNDSRVRVFRRDTRGGFAAAAKDAIAMARGEFVGFVDAGEAVAESALFEFAAEEDAAILYSDEDSLDERGERCRPRFKTAWNPELLQSQEYLGRLVFFRRERIAAIDGWSSEWELALRATDGLDRSRIRHVPAVLCHRRDARFSDRGGTRVEDRADWPRVSAIIATRDRAELLERCVDGLLHRTDYPDVEVIVMDHDSREERTAKLFAKFREMENVRVLPYAGEFNWAAMNNAGARVAGGEVLLFLNNDTDVIEKGWLRELCAHATRDGVGAAGAKLLFADGTVQHAGIWLGPGGRVRHLLRLSQREDPGYLGQLAWTRNLSAVTGACMAMRAEVFRELDGFDESYPVSYNDLDLCLRAIQKGYRIVWTPHAELLHLESASRGSSEWRWRSEEADHKRFVAKWEREINQDPFFNPNLELIGEEKLALACPPRVKRAWRI